MATTINDKVNHIFTLLTKLANEEELYVQDTALQEELFGQDESLKDAQKANERKLRRYLEDIEKLYGHILVLEKKQKDLSDRKVNVYRVANKKDISHVLKFFMQQSSDLRWILQMLHEQDASLLHELEADTRKSIENEMSKDADIFLFNSQPFELLESDHLKKIFAILKCAVKEHEYRTISYEYKNSEVLQEAKCLKLIYTQNNWYLAVETSEAKFRLLRLHFIKEIGYAKKSNFQKSVLDKYSDYFARFENAMSLFTQEVQVAHLKVAPFIAIYFQEGMKPFFKSQKHIKTYEDGSIEFSVNFTQPLEILPFVKQWLPGMQILSPDSLKKTLVYELQSAINTHTK